MKLMMHSNSVVRDQLLNKKEKSINLNPRKWARHPRFKNNKNKSPLYRYHLCSYRGMSLLERPYSRSSLNPSLNFKPMNLN